MVKIHKIAVFISHIFGDYQRNVCQGVIDKARSYGYHVDIFVSNDENVLGEFGLGEFGVLRIPHPESYDGVILSSSTYLLPELRRKVLDYLQLCPCPIIDINSPGSPFPSVLLDNNTVTGKLVEHLIQVHRLTDIRYLGNLSEQAISNVRRQACMNALCAAGLAAGAYSSADSDYSREGIAAALDFFLENRLPQAIVCYNDAMAFTLMTLLAERGIKVPEQIAVTGCDYLEFGQNIEPPLTTITFPAYELGEAAFESLLSLLDQKESGKIPPPHYFFPKNRFIQYCNSLPTDWRFLRMPHTQSFSLHRIQLPLKREYRFSGIHCLIQYTHVGGTAGGYGHRCRHGQTDGISWGY